MSFISVEPQPRVVSESHSNSLIAQFDTQLQIIVNRYLAFFQESLTFYGNRSVVRRNIEATYINSLRKLHHKAKNVDAAFDPRAEPTTTRAAWDTVRDNVDREASTQQAFVDILDNDVIKPLTTLKESKDRTRNRIEECLQRSATSYADHAENKVSKLQQAYLKKYYPQQHATPTEASQRPQSFPNKRFGGKVSALFRGRREDSQEPESPKPTKPEEVSDNDCRLAVGRLNALRSARVEYLGEGYECLEELVFAPTVKDVLVKYVDGMVTTCAKYDKLATSTRTRVEKAVAGTDTSDLRASFRRALSFSIPPPTLYRNYRPGAYSELIFGVPLVDVETNEDNVPKVMKMCIEEVEKRGLVTNKIYSVHQSLDAEVLKLRDKLENEKSFSFSSTDDIHSVAMLLMRYFWDLPESLFTLSLQDYRNYRQNRARYTENDFSLWRSKIRELHPVHRASLGALLQHLLRVSSHSDKNAMTVKALAARFRYAVLRGGQFLQDETLVLEDLIQNANILFNERPSLPDATETMSTQTYGSLFLSPELPQLAEVLASPTRHRPGLVGGIAASIQSSSSFSSSPSDAATESRLTPSPTGLLSPLLGLPSSQTLTERVETTTQEQAIQETGGTKAVETLPDSTPAKVVSAPSTTVAEWRLRQSLLLLSHPEPLTIPQSPPESVLSYTSDFPLSSATSLQTGMGAFSP
ncbi:hypothetical protein EDB89DRAFT_2138609 [Lactarius sanguifluus]|nr:hypothetical protein EDB89DRAFT_2138609 [Lactarius sanguifluus]